MEVINQSHNTGVMGQVETIDLQDIETFPNEFIEKLSAYDELFKSHEFLEEIESNHMIQLLILQINDYCEMNRIIGFHYTRSIPQNILDKGLKIRSGSEIRRDFLNDHGKLFTDQELNLMKQRWLSNFWEEQENVRGNRIFFNFTLTELHGLGARDLLNNYGGEQVYFCIDEIDGVSEKIKSLGVPLVAKCTLNPNDVTTFGENCWGKIAVSTYHRTVNPKAHTVDRDGYQCSAVLPESVELYQVTANEELQLINR
jgi:hypothetical protein